MKAKHGQPKVSPTGGGGPPQGRRPYSRPRLIDFGDVRDLTLGPTPGITDSGGFGEAFPFGPGPGPGPGPAPGPKG